MGTCHEACIKKLLRVECIYFSLLHAGKNGKGQINKTTNQSALKLAHVCPLWLPCLWLYSTELNASKQFKSAIIFYSPMQQWSFVQKSLKWYLKAVGIRISIKMILYQYKPKSLASCNSPSHCRNVLWTCCCMPVTKFLFL